MKITKFTADFQSIGTMENENTKTWTAEMWEESLPIYESILEQPFIRELADGSLSQERFSRYIAQDEIYLGNYGKQMEAFAELLDDADEKSMFKALAEAGKDSENCHPPYRNMPCSAAWRVLGILESSFCDIVKHLIAIVSFSCATFVVE